MLYLVKRRSGRPVLVYIRSRLQLYEFEFGIHSHAHKESLAPAPEPQRRQIWKKGGIPITQIDDEVKVLGEDRLQSNF